MEVSIIIPVYNTERYITQCLDSVIAQTFISKEIILIDDGSTDDSGKICDAYAGKHDNIKVYHAKNQGAAASRNKGIELARGVYLLFLDSDDYYNDAAMVDQLYRKAVEYDIDMLCFGLRYFYTDDCKKDRSAVDRTLFLDDSKTATIRYLVKNNLYTSSSCIKFISHVLIKEHSIRFEEGIRCEDINFSFQLLLYCRKTAYLSNQFYSYRMRSDSTTHTINSKSIENMIYSIDSMCRTLKELGQQDLDIYMGYIAYQYATLLINIHKTDCRINRKLKEDVYGRKYLLKYHENKYVRIIYIFYKLFGIKITSFILSVYYRLRG